MGWSTYFAFILAALNTLTVTYYLAIDNYPVLKQIFPSFELYIVVIVSIGIPLLSNPYQARFLVNTEMILKLNLMTSQMISKIAKGEKISEEEIKEITDLQKKFETHASTRTFDNKQDRELIPK